MNTESVQCILVVWQYMSVWIYQWAV